MLLKVRAPEFTAFLTIERGICTEADPPLAHCRGASVQWVKGHFIFKNWTATQIPQRAAPSPQMSLDLA
jgi:hypothetical protein